MKYNILALLCLSTILLFTACNKGGKTGLLIPADAAFVLHADLSSLASKLSWQEIQQTSWYAEVQKQGRDSLAKKLLANPANFGLDTDGSLTLFLKRSGNSGYLALQGKLKNAEQFRNTLTAAGNNRITIEKDGNLNYARMDGKDDATIYFNNKIFVFVADASETKKAGRRMPPLQSSAKKYSLDSLRHFAKNIFNLKGKNLLDSDKRFAELIDDKADFHYWMNSGYLYDGMLTGPMAMMKIGDVLAGNISTGKANFENGKIVVSGTQFYNKLLADLLKKYAGKRVSGELLSKLPDDNVLAAFAMNYNPEGIKEMLKLLGMDGMANAAMALSGYSVDEFVKANAGELAFAITGYGVTKNMDTLNLENGQTITYENEKPDLKFVFSTAINDDAAFQKLVDVVGKNYKDKISVAIDTAQNTLTHKTEGKWFAFGTKGDVNAFFSGNKKPAYSNTFSGHNGGGYMDLQKIITAMAANNKDTAYKKVFDTSLPFWKNMHMYWDVKDGTATSYFEINVADAQTNALKQLNRYFDQLYLAMPKDQNEIEIKTVTL